MANNCDNCLHDESEHEVVFGEGRGRCEHENDDTHNQCPCDSFTPDDNYEGGHAMDCICADCSGAELTADND